MRRDSAGLSWTGVREPWRAELGARSLLVHQMHAHPDLAVAGLAQRPGILAGHARRRLPVLGKPGVIDHQRLHRLAGGELPRHIPAHCRVIPGRGRDERLQPLVIGTQPHRHRPHRLAPPVGQQPALILARQVTMHLRGKPASSGRTSAIC